MDGYSIPDVAVIVTLTLPANPDYPGSEEVSYDVTDHFLDGHMPTADEAWWTQYDYRIRSLIAD